MHLFRYMYVLVSVPAAAAVGALSYLGHLELCSARVEVHTLGHVGGVGSLLDDFCLFFHLSGYDSI